MPFAPRENTENKHEYALTSISDTEGDIVLYRCCLRCGLTLASWPSAHEPDSWRLVCNNDEDLTGDQAECIEAFMDAERDSETVSE